MVDNSTHLHAHHCRVHKSKRSASADLAYQGARFTVRRLPSIHSSLCISPALRIDNPIKRSTVKAEQDHSPKRLMGSCVSYLLNTALVKHPARVVPKAM